MTSVILHGNLGEQLGKEWDLAISSVGEAVHAINVMTDNKLKRTLWDNDSKNIRYKVLVNKRPFFISNRRQDNEVNLIQKNMETIDIVPVLEGREGWDTALTVVGSVLLAFSGDSPTAAIAGMAMIFAGISNMLSKPPERPDQRQIMNPSSDPSELANSYLFSGPVNVINEGGPVPIGYGRLMVGSQVIQASYDVRAVLTRDAGRQR